MSVFMELMYLGLKGKQGWHVLQIQRERFVFIFKSDNLLKHTHGKRLAISVNRSFGRFGKNGNASMKCAMC